MKSKVYFTKVINSESLIKIFNSLNVDLKGKTAIKISTGEPDGHNFLNPNLIKDLIKKLDGTIVECCTAYKGKRFDVTEHWETIKNHGFMNIAPCDIMDEDGEMELHFDGGKHLKGINYVGSHLNNYDSMLMLSHFKGHQMGGFGGALKNMSIGIASRNGKAWIHSAGITTSPEEVWNHVDNQNGFLESMAEADKSVIEFFKTENMAYINVANNLSIDCDCNSNPTTPEMKDIGVFASIDPVALDQACCDSIFNSDDDGKVSLINRINERNGIHILEEAEKLNIGSRDYELINID